MAKDYYDMPTDNTKMGDYYDQMGVELYDAMMDSVNWTEPDEIVTSVLNLQLPKTAKVLDVGAGTGRIGSKLTKNGFNNLHALDASDTLLGALKAKNLYQTANVAFLGYGNFPKEEQKENYDLVTASGVFMKGHIPCSGLDEIAGFIRPGGYFVTAMREMYFTPGEEMGFYEHIHELQDTGIFELLELRKFKRGLSDAENVSGNPLFQEMNSVLFVFRKA